MNAPYPAESHASGTPPMEVFISYAQEDTSLLQELEKHLSLLKRQGVISTWQNRQIVAGTDRAQAIGTQLERAQVILLLISADFVASDYCYGKELQHALARQQAGQAQVIPILLRPVDWHGAPFAHLQALPKSGKAVTSWTKRDEAFSEIASELRRMIATFTGSPPAPIVSHSAQQEATPPPRPAASKYHIVNQQGVQGQVIGDHATVSQSFGPTTQSSSADPPSQRSSALEVCVVCALPEEAQAFLRVVEQQTGITWSHGVNARYGYDDRQATIENTRSEPLRVQVSWLPRSGPLTMSVHLTHVIEEYRPHLVLMTGICAGDRRAVALGDLVVAERTFSYDTGKIVNDADGQPVHLHDTLTHQANENLLRFVGVFEEWKALVAALPRPLSKRQQRDWLLDRLFHEPTASLRAIARGELEQHAPAWRALLAELQHGREPFLLPSLVLREREQVEHLSYGRDPFPFQDRTSVQCHIRPLASGSAVRADDPFGEIQRPVRGAIAIDMEGAAVGQVLEGVAATQWLIVKGVCDYADQDKDDTYHTYAAEVSALYALSFLQHYVTHERFAVRQQNQPQSHP